MRDVSSRLGEGYGLRRSLLEEVPVDPRGNPLPWYTFPAIEFLDDLDFSAAKMFEFGAGNSTLYWATQSASVVSVEHDAGWADHIRSVVSRMPNIVILHEKDPVAYSQAIKSHGRFDIIAVDGLERLACAKAALECRMPGGVIILDNSDGYPNVAALLREDGGLLQIDFNGFGPRNTVPWRTSVFIDREFERRRKADAPRRFQAAY